MLRLQETPKLRIAQVITGSVSMGGAEAHVRDLAIGLSARGHDCTVLVGPPGGLFTRQLGNAGIPVRTLPSLQKAIRPARDTAALRELLAELRRLRPDVVAVHTAKAGLVGRLAARILRIPCVFTPHGLSIVDRATGERKQLFVALEQLAGRLASKLILVCEYERRLAEINRIAGTNKLSVIHNGIPDMTDMADPGKEAVVITMVGRFGHQKDHLTLFKALQQLTGKAWTLRLAGVGPLLQAAKNQAERLGIASRVEFLGECDNTPRLLSESQIFVLSSHFEAFPISILEAMRAGLPVVASDVGGVAEAVCEGKTGFMVSPSRPDLLASKLDLLLSHSRLRMLLGKNGRNRYLSCFTSEQMITKTLDIYTEAAGYRTAAHAHNDLLQAKWDIAVQP